jgi:CRP-like cAMP-binding protein
MIPIQELRKIVILQKLSDEMLEKIVPLVSILKLREEETVFEEGGEPKNFYMLTSGKILLEQKISDNISVSLGAIKPGYSFGWSSIFGQPYSFKALCAETSEILMINAESLLQILQQDHSMGFSVMTSLTILLKNRMDRVESRFLRLIKEHDDFKSLID